MKVILVSYYFREKEKVNFGKYPVVFQLAKRIGQMASSKPFSWR